MINITKLLANFKAKENKLLMKIIKGIKDILELQSNDDKINTVSVTMPDNRSDLKQCCLKNTHSALKPLPKSKSVSHSHILNASAKEPVRFVLLLGSK